MLSQKARYALRALLFLAARGAPATSAEMAAAERIPRKFLEMILFEMKMRGLVVSRRGKGGGYALARSAEDISFADVIRSLDGPLALAPCASQTAYRKCDDCHDVETCPTRRVLLAVRDATAGILESTSLADAVKGGPEIAAFSETLSIQ